jgi:plastocyanin
VQNPLFPSFIVRRGCAKPILYLNIHGATSSSDKEKELTVSQVKEKNSLTTNAEVAPEPVKASQVGWFSRPRRSPFGRVAFVVSIVRTLGGIGGLVPFLMSGSMSPDVLTLAICSLATMILLATRYRWATLVATPLAAYITYITLKQPFALFDLANPYGPNGGFPFFVLGVVAFALSILMLGSLIGASLEILNQRPSPRWVFAALMSLVAGLMIGSIFIGAISSTQNAAGATGTILTNGVPTVHVGAGGFVQSSVTLSKGQDLLLVSDSSVQHDLVLGQWQSGQPVTESEPGAPAVNNMILHGQNVTIGPFNTAGTYHIICVIHTNMSLTVVVQ